MSVDPIIIDNLPTLTINGLNVASTIDPVNDYLPIYTASATATQAINRNTLLDLSSTPVGLTDTQTLTNKTLTGPTISGPVLSGTITGTYTIGGTPTFPSSVTQNTATQTLTNKTLTSPVINSPTITNATYTGDAIVGYTTGNAGTVYGVSISGGTIGTSGIASNAITYAKLATSIFSGQINSFSNSGTAGGMFYYANLGGIKLLWGQTANNIGSTTPTSYILTIPAFFSAIQTVQLTVGPGNTTNNQSATIAAGGISTTSVSINVYASSTTTAEAVNVFIVGS